jgi:membrane protease YdiL (CAAX protease family)
VARAGRNRTLTFLALWYLFLFGVFLPYVVIKSQRAVRAGATVPPRPAIYRKTLTMQALFLLVALFAAHQGELELFGRGTVGLGAIAATAALLVAAVAAQQVVWRLTPPELGRRILLSRPHHLREMGWWCLVSLAAGVVEEIAYRGVLPALVAPLIATSSGREWAADALTLGGALSVEWCAAAAIAVVAFVLGHYGQGLPRLVFLATFSIACHLLVRRTGSLYPAMALHVAYDVLAGLVAIRMARRLAPVSC